MRISLSPQRREGALALARSGDVLFVNGELLDLSAIPDGATLAAEAISSDWITGDVHRIDGTLHVTILLPVGANPSQALAFPEDLVDFVDGPINLPTQEG